MIRLLAGGVLAVALPCGVAGQGMGDLQSAPARGQRGSFVSYAAEPATVAAGTRAVVEVRLRVAEGFHVNSHRPAAELLIPTVATLAPGDGGVKLGEIEYPAGTSYRVESDPGTKLDVYTGAVVLRVPVTAAAGEHVLTGSLRYQACDRAACYPPKTLALAVPFTAK